MFRGGGSADKTAARSKGSELPVDGAIRVRKVERIQAYNIVSRPSVYYGSPTAIAGPAESLAVRVVRVGDVEEKPDGGFRSVSIRD